MQRCNCPHCSGEHVRRVRRTLTEKYLRFRGKKYYCLTCRNRYYI